MATWGGRGATQRFPGGDLALSWCPIPLFYTSTLLHFYCAISYVKCCIYHGVLLFYSAIVPCPIVTPIVVSYGTLLSTLLLCYCTLSYVVEKCWIYYDIVFVQCGDLALLGHRGPHSIASSML